MKTCKIVAVIEFVMLFIAAVLIIHLGFTNIKIQDKVAYEIINSSYSVYNRLNDEELTLGDNDLAILSAMEESISVCQSYCNKSEVVDLSELVYWTNRMLLEYRTAIAHDTQFRSLKILKQLAPYYKAICYAPNGEPYEQGQTGLWQGLQELSKLMDSEDYQRIYHQMVDVIS